MDVHDNWRRILSIYKRLFSYVERSPDINFDFTPQEVVEDLKEFFLGELRNVVQERAQYFLKDEKWEEEWEYKKKGKFWQCEYEGDADSRDECFKDIISHFESLGEDIISLTIIDDLKKAIISTTERNKSQATRKAVELKKLQERINQMKEHTL